ncbi:hypothetical protein LAV79_24600 [Peribacillus butanolivorans]|uniref:hypothetical protein n=1 Tax=Peribacillus butanolivorans TaxID=421767 RepID=UPI0030C915E6
MVTIEQFVRIYRAKISFGKKKRLSAIQEYFATEHNTQYEFNEDSNQCLEIIINFVQENPLMEQNVFTDIVDLLHDRYSLGDAFIIYNADINQNLDFDRFSEVINDLFENTIERDMFNFDADHVNVDDVGQTIKIKCRYREYQRDIGNDIRSENINHSGQIPIYFDFSKQKILINTGYNKAANTLVKAINESINSFSIYEVKVKDNVRQIPNLIGVTDFDPLSLLSLYLILQELSSNNYIVNDILSISFNNEQAPRVKKARLGGTNLLQDSDVVHRVYRGDCITNFILDIIHLNHHGQADLIAEVHFDFRTDLKVSFISLQTPGTLTVQDACLEIEQIINNAIDQNTVQHTLALINANLPRMEVNNQELFANVLINIKEQLCGIITNQEDKDAVEGYFNTTYRL